MSNSGNKDQRVPPVHFVTTDEEESETISPENLDVYRQKAVHYNQAGIWTLAFNFYNRYFTLMQNCCNNTRLSTQIDFTNVAKRMVRFYEHVNDDEYLMKCLLQILNLLPDNLIILNLLGEFMFKKGEFSIAEKYLERAFKSPVTYLPVEKNLLHLKWHQIPRWHFRMLNNKKRNNAYFEAINKRIKQEKHEKLFNIGAGCGLLTLITAKIDDKIKIIAFEENPILATITEKLIKQNQIEQRVKFHKHNSIEFKHLQQPEQRGKLLLTENFDIQIFGGHMLTLLLHAIDRFIDDEDDDFTIIPASVQLYVTGIECERISNRYRYKRDLNDLNLHDVCIRLIDNEKYIGEDLTRHDYRVITTTKMFLKVDFRDEFQLLNLTTMRNSIDLFDLECIENGRIDILVVWFDLNLDNDIMITTNPLIDNENYVECWDQAIFNLKHPIYIQKGDRLNIEPQLNLYQLDFKIINDSNDCKKCFLVNRETVTLLNDDRFFGVLKTAFQTFKDRKNLTIVDYNNFPLFGLLMCKFTDAKIYHLHRNINDLELIQYLLIVNEIDSDRFVSLQQRSSYDYLCILKKIDLVVSNLINIDGSLYRQTLPDELLLKHKPLVLPTSIIVKAQLINSTYLDTCNRIDDGNCFNFGIAPLMNQYTGTEHPNLDNFNYTPLSTIVEFDISDTLSNCYLLEQIADITIDSDTVNAILIWYDLKFTDNDDSFFTTFNSLHYCRTCFLLNEPKIVVKDEKIRIYLQQDETFMKVFLPE